MVILISLAAGLYLYGAYILLRLLLVDGVHDLKGFLFLFFRTIFWLPYILTLVLRIWYGGKRKMSDPEEKK